jgi:hypothetical protein
MEKAAGGMSELVISCITPSALFLAKRGVVTLMKDLSHAATLRVDVTADAAFDFLADPLHLGRWSLGCFDTEPAGAPGLFTGVSLYDGARGYVRIDADRTRHIIDYHVGDAVSQVPRVSIRVVPGSVCGLPTTSCYVTLTAWRLADMADERWFRLRAAHEAEIWMIKAQIESGATLSGLPDGATG